MEPEAFDDMVEGLKMKYFVLKPKGDDIYARASRRAMEEYAKVVFSTNPDLARDLLGWADGEETKARLKRKEE
uniref:Uncharacterized protein n=1 Tax=viral metagenome TaxID=1070528 RepID=A0A6H1ZHN1_9ZZZZ